MPSWTPAPDIESKLGSLGKRAKKRSGIQTGPKTFLVFGDGKLGDSFDKYDVRLVGDKYECSCQNHRGGQYRNMCSHISYVILAKRGIVEWANPGVEDEPEQTAQVLDELIPDAPLPLFVDQGQPWNEGVWDAMDAYFGGDRVSEFTNNRTLPPWVKFIREHQWDAYSDIISAFDSGKKVVFLSAPTGSGKTLIAEMVRRKWWNGDPQKWGAIYTCTTKTLQDQFEEDFTYAKVIKGRSNYPTANFPDTEWLACDLCEARDAEDSCKYCGSQAHCPYIIAREDARLDPLAVANVAYLLAEGNTQHSKFRGRELVIIDEADSLEDELMRYVEISISPRMQKRLGISPPEKKTVADSWEVWRDEHALPRVKAGIAKLKGSREPRDIRMRTTLNRLADKLEAASFIDEESPWVYTGYDSNYITFKPVKVDTAAPDVLWSLGQRFLLMSATIVSAQQMAEDLGLEDDEWSVVDVPSTFPPENRPIYVEPVADMTAKKEADELPKMLERIDQIADWHQERILIHTVSYRLTKAITKHLGSRAITYYSAKDREKALAAFRDSANGILVAPSFERGIDLPYDQCRVVIVAKVPFPYLGDKQVSKRLYSRGGQGWYSMQTVRSLVQMTGRAMRHEDDECEIYLLDKQFISNIWKKSKRLLPDWWKEALQMGGSPNLAQVRAGGLS